MAELILLIIGFIAFAGLFALVEAAILSISKVEVEEMVMQKKWGAIALKKARRHLTRAVSVLVIFINATYILGPILVGQKAIELFGSHVIGILTGALTFGTIIFSEIIPKSAGAHYAPVVSRVSAPFLLGLCWVLFPVVVALDWLTSFVKNGARSIGTEAQIRSLATMGRRAGHIEKDEGQLVHRAFILNDKTAEQVMTYLKDVVSVQEKNTIREAADKVFKETFSRYPVFGPSIHDVKGIVMSHDILEALTEGRDSEPVSSITRERLVVSEDKPLDDLMVLFRDASVHLAVVQKGGKTVGLVTLEDVLEELVGEIEDEKDAEKE